MSISLSLKRGHAWLVQQWARRAEFMATAERKNVFIFQGSFWLGHETCGNDDKGNEDTQCSKLSYVAKQL